MTPTLHDALEALCREWEAEARLQLRAGNQIGGNLLLRRAEDQRRILRECRGEGKDEASPATTA